MSKTKSVSEVRADVMASIEQMRKGDFKAHFGDDLDKEYSEALEHLRHAHALLYEIENTPLAALTQQNGDNNGTPTS